MVGKERVEPRREGEGGAGQTDRRTEFFFFFFGGFEWESSTGAGQDPVRIWDDFYSLTSVEITALLLTIHLSPSVIKWVEWGKSFFLGKKWGETT